MLDYDAIVQWLKFHILSVSALYQAVVIFLVVLIGIFFINSIDRKKKGRLKRKIGFKAITPFNISQKEFYSLGLITLLLWLSTIVYETFTFDYFVLKTTTSFFTAWFFIRIITSILKSPFWEGCFSVLIWTIAALEILDLLIPTIAFLDAQVFQMGDFRISLLTLMKAIILFSFLFWGINLLTTFIQYHLDTSKSFTPRQRILFGKLINISLYILTILFGLNFIGLHLTTLTVLTGALGVGIGFGLQKIIANFISGLIILTDRSVRPGDVIVVGDTYGVVKDLKSRYAIVVTRDGKKHLIPNEHFVTEKVENWSRGDKFVRQRLPIGVSYDSDIKLAQKLIAEAAFNHPRILKEPSPKCLLRNFGDNAVEFELRYWLNDPENGIGVPRSDVLLEIWDKFKENNIEIPYAHLDVHLVGSNPLKNVLGD